MIWTLRVMTPRYVLDISEHICAIVYVMYLYGTINILHSYEISDEFQLKLYTNVAETTLYSQ